MFRDKEEELRRLEQELLAEEEPQEEEEYLDDETIDALLEEPKPGDAPKVYQNFSNGYGKHLRNYASGYKAYNADHTDVTPEQLSQELLYPKKHGSALWLALLLILLTAVAVVAIALLYKKLGGPL